MSYLFEEYRKKGTQLLRPYIEGESLAGVSISDADKENGSPKFGDMIAVSRDDDLDRWLVSEAFYKNNYELASQKASQKYMDESINKGS